MAASNWTIQQTEYIKSEQGYYETLFALANGYIGVRNTLDFDSEESHPGVFFANIYDGALFTRNEIVNAVNWLDFTYAIDGYPLLLDQLEILDFQRELDMKRGIVHLTYRVRDLFKRVTRIERTDFLYAKDYHLALVRGCIQPENYSAPLDLTSYLNYHYGNSMFGGYLKEVRTQHLRKQLLEMGNHIYLETETVGSGVHIGITTKLMVTGEVHRMPIYGRQKVGEKVRIVGEQGQSYSFIKYVCFYNSHDQVECLRTATTQKLDSVIAHGYEAVLADHIAIWNERWHLHDVIIEGDERAQEAMRFGIFHLMQAAHPEKDGTNIASRGLTSEYHHGHFFFNTEIYKSPYFMYMNPSVARSLLRYRYNSLDACRKVTKEMGYRGVRFSEESDHEGVPAGPTQIRNIFTGEVMEEWTGRETQYVGALCVYSLEKYYQITQDEDFMLQYGLEILIETARFASSLVVFDEKRQQYDIHQVTGPDEYHMHVDNSFFTNYMIRYNIDYSLRMLHTFYRVEQSFVEALYQRLNVTNEELVLWEKIRDQLYRPSQHSGVFEQFDGYFDLQNAWIKEYDQNQRPVITEEFANVANSLLNSTNQIIKQSDIIMLISLFRDQFSLEEKCSNLGYYDKRTAHESSLSASHTALVAIDVNDLEMAYRYFLICIRFNLDFIPRTDYRNGIHLASYAGGWLVLVEGFVGISIKGDHMTIAPKLPGHWRKVAFRIWWCHSLLQITLSQEAIGIEVVRSGMDTGRILIGDMQLELSEISQISLPIQ